MADLLEYTTKSNIIVESSNAVPANYEGHIYAVVTPILNGWAFLGETDKYVTASSKRFTKVQGEDLSLFSDSLSIRKSTYFQHNL